MIARHGSRVPWPGGAPALVLTLLVLGTSGCGMEGDVPSEARAEKPEALGLSAQVISKGPSTIFLVRHAEKADEPAEDPRLTNDGQERARELARLLGQAGVTRIHSTDTRRTRDTARPLAEAGGLEIELYESADSVAFVSELMEAPGRHLVVGHSNTVPPLAEAFGGEGFGEIVEEWEYDRLYVLSPRSRGMETILLRFGAPARP